MIYILKKQDNDKNQNIIKRIYNFILNIYLPFTINQYEENYILVLNNSEKRNLKKLLKFLKTNCTKNVCISRVLENDVNFNIFLKENNINCFNGSWLFKYVIIDIVEFILLNKNDTIERQDISILANEINENIIETIKHVALKSKCLNIVTHNTNLFYRLEKSLYEEYGIVINISNNYEKSIRKSNFIINYDFSEEEINKYNIYQKACIINVNTKAKINKKAFNGLYINYFNIYIPQKYIRFKKLENDFKEVSLYESLIYKNTISKNIMEEIKRDDVKIRYLEGLNGIISKDEYLKI